MEKSAKVFTSQCSKYWMKPNNTTTNSKPNPKMRFPIPLVMMNASRERGFSLNTEWSGGNEARAMAANVSMMRLIHSICVTVRGDVVPKMAPISTMRHAATLMVIWNNIKRCMLRYKERPHITARVMLLNELSRMVMSLASLATEVPSPIERPIWAWFRAGASLVPSPVTATTSPCSCSKRTRRSLSDGRARDMIFRSPMRSFSSSSLNRLNSLPVII